MSDWERDQAVKRAEETSRKDCLEFYRRFYGHTMSVIFLNSQFHGWVKDFCSPLGKSISREHHPAFAELSLLGKTKAIVGYARGKRLFESDIHPLKSGISFQLIGADDWWPQNQWCLTTAGNLWSTPGTWNAAEGRTINWSGSEAVVNGTSLPQLKVLVPEERVPKALRVTVTLKFSDGKHYVTAVFDLAQSEKYFWPRVPGENYFFDKTFLQNVWVNDALGWHALESGQISKEAFNRTVVEALMSPLDFSGSNSPSEWSWGSSGGGVGSCGECGGYCGH